MNTISFMTANYVARQIGYQMSGGWEQGDHATNEYFRPLDTFAQRFEALVVEIKALGFDAIDLWLSHLNYSWVTDEHLRIAHALLARHKLEVVSLAGWLGSTPSEFQRTCEIAVAVGTSLLGADTSMLRKNRHFVVQILKDHDLRLGIENHPEKTPEDILAKIGDGGDGRLGATVDTGWFGTQGYDAAQAIERLRDHLFHVHLKDVRASGAHDTCRYGEGIVPRERCVRTLRKIGYTGAMSVEHEPERFDPSDDCRACFAMLRTWLAEPNEEDL
jgi:sugar phosphate isomerase/epimerase